MKVAALILAAGPSSRLGRPKQLLVYDGKTLVRRTVEPALEAGCWPVIVVAGREEKEIRAELAATGVEVLRNDAWPRGMGTSIRAGMGKITAEDAVILLVCDQPGVDAELLERIIDRQKRTHCSMIGCAYAGTIGVPALFLRACFYRLRTVADQEGAKSLLLERPEEVAMVDFPDGAMDIDTIEDYRELLEKSEI